MIGEIKLLPTQREIYGHLLCDNREYKISDYPALFALISTEFGGDGHETFRVPPVSHSNPNLFWHIVAKDEDFPDFD